MSLHKIKDDKFFICNINIENDVCNKHSTTICSKCDVKIRKPTAAHLWTEYNPEKKMKVKMK